MTDVVTFYPLGRIGYIIDIAFVGNICRLAVFPIKFAQLLIGEFLYFSIFLRSALIFD